MVAMARTPLVHEIIENIVENFNPEKIVSVGSYARGSMRLDSDLDFFVIFNETLVKEFENTPVRPEDEKDFAENSINGFVSLSSIRCFAGVNRVLPILMKLKPFWPRTLLDIFVYAPNEIVRSYNPYGLHFLNRVLIHKDRSPMTAENPYKGPYKVLFCRVDTCRQCQFKDCASFRAAGGRVRSLVYPG
jgi:predicted nucleotidyltransferase